MTPVALVLAVSIAAPLVALAGHGGTVVILPPALPTAGAIVLVLTACALLWRYIGRPIYKALCWVRERLEENGALVEQVRELVQYVGLFGGDVEARLDRIEKALGLGYYRRDTDKPMPFEPPTPVQERLRTHQAIRDLDGGEPPTG